LVGRAAETRQVVLVADVSREPAWLPNPLLPETRAEMAVPIIIGGHVLGVMDIQHNVTNGLQENDIELVQSLANQVAVALQNARLYTQAQHQAERETFLNSISQRIQRATSIEAVLQIAAEELGRTTGATQATVQLTNPVRLGNGRSQEPA
jgi:GAF domain-containing protein